MSEKLTREQILAMADEELANLILDKVAEELMVDDIFNLFGEVGGDRSTESGANPF
jgi:hypothetical protein